MEVNVQSSNSLSAGSKQVLFRSTIAKQRDRSNGITVRSNNRKWPEIKQMSDPAPISALTSIINRVNRYHSRDNMQTSRLCK